MAEEEAADNAAAEGDPFLDIWNSYLPDSKRVDPAVLKPVAEPSAPLSGRGVAAPDEKLTNTLRDATWIGTNQAAARLAKQTAVLKTAPILGAELKAANADNQATYLVSKQKYKRPAAPPLAATAPAAALPIAAAAATTSANTNARAQLQVPPAQREAVVPPATAPVRVLTLEEHNARNKVTDLFAMQIERQPRTATTEMIINTPPPVQTLQYCAQLQTSQVPWYDAMKQIIANKTDITFPKTPIMRRSVLMTFLRQADPKQVYERPCFNLDRNPYQHEHGLRMRCVAHRLSAEQLGDARAFRCRELLFANQQVRINAALESGGRDDPRRHLNNIPELCYMCHVWLTTEAALAQRNKPTPPSANDMLVIFNRFMVMIDQIGEYRLSATLCSEDVSLGIWGPFPRWNERHYRAARLSCGLYAFEESEEMLFRLAREPSSLSATVAAKATDSQRSDPTAVTRTAASNCHQ